MTDEELQPDAWRFENYIKMKTDSVTRITEKHPRELNKIHNEIPYEVVPDTPEPLFSAATIREYIVKEVIRFEQEGIISAGQAEKINDRLTEVFSGAED